MNTFVLTRCQISIQRTIKQHKERLVRKRNVLQTFEWGSFSFFGLDQVEHKVHDVFERRQSISAEVKVSMKEYINQDMFEVGGSRHNITVLVKLVQMEADKRYPVWRCTRYHDVCIGAGK